MQSLSLCLVYHYTGAILCFIKLVTRDEMFYKKTCMINHLYIARVDTRITGRNAENWKIILKVHIFCSWSISKAFYSISRTMFSHKTSFIANSANELAIRFDYITKERERETVDMNKNIYSRNVYIWALIEKQFFAYMRYNIDILKLCSDSYQQL